MTSGRWPSRSRAPPRPRCPGSTRSSTPPTAGSGSPNTTPRRPPARGPDLDDGRALALEEPRTAPTPVSRLDAFFDPADGRLRITEYNAETPAGSAYNDALPE